MGGRLSLNSCKTIPMSKFNIIIACSHAIIREGVSSILRTRENYEVVHSVETADELFDLLKCTTPSAVIVDPDHLKGFDHCSFQRIYNLYDISNVLVLTGEQSHEFILGILVNNITHLLSINCTVEELFGALDAIAGNEDYLCKRAIEVLLNENKNGAQHKINDECLTKKEIEIIKLLTDGLSTKDIAAKLFLSGHTVNTHRRNILKKLKFNNTSELVMYAVKKGIVDVMEYYI